MQGVGPSKDRAGGLPPVPTPLFILLLSFSFHLAVGTSSGSAFTPECALSTFSVAEV